LCNDGALYIPTLPFGGVGESGHGAYCGRASFDVWVYRCPITFSPSWLEPILSTRYPLYEGKLSGYKAISLLKPDFDRSGRKLRLGWICFIFILGGGSVTAGAIRGTVCAGE
jgi:beta-apo-4'-carotenal oxygenase